MPDRHKMIAIVPAGQNDGLFLSCTQESNFVYKTGPQKTQASLICTLWKSEQFSIRIEILIEFSIGIYIRMKITKQNDVISNQNSPSIWVHEVNTT